MKAIFMLQMVVDPLTNTVVGEFEMVDTQSVFSIDPLTNRIFFASENSSNSAELKIYDLSTFQLLARAPIPVQLSSEAPREIIYLDANKFALTTRENNLYFFEIVPLENSVYLPQISNDYCGGPYTDDFSDTLSGWPRITTTSYLADYWNSEYRVNQNLANKWTAVTKGDIWNNSELVQIDGRLASGDGVWGLLFGLNSDWSNFYTFEILPNTQSWAIFHYSNGWYPVANGTSSAILPGTAINTLSIKHPTNGIQLQVNGTTVYSTTEKAGRVGLTGGSFVKSTDIRYDNYIFADKNCATSELFSFDSGILDQLPLHIESPNYSSLLSGD